MKFSKYILADRGEVIYVQPGLRFIEERERELMW